MENYYCEVCNKNVNIGYNLIYQDCGYYLVEGKLNPEQIERRQIERKAYCGKCEKTILSVPTQFVIEHFRQERDDKIENFQYTIPRGSCLCFILITCLIPILAALVVITYGLLAIPLVIVAYFYFRYQKQRAIRQISYVTQKMINTLKERQKEFEFICHYCASGVYLSA